MSKLLRTFSSVSSQSVLQVEVIHGGSKSVNLVSTKDNPSFDVNAQHVQVSSTGMFGPIPSKSIGRFGNTSSITTKVTSDSLFTSSFNEVGLPQSPLVSPTAPLPLHQSNVDVAATFGVSLSTVGDLEIKVSNSALVSAFMTEMEVDSPVTQLYMFTSTSNEASAGSKTVPTSTGAKAVIISVNLKAIQDLLEARRALRALKGLVKLQDLVKGFLVRKQVAATLYSMQVLLRAQLAVRSKRAELAVR
ncbi:protein IQ-DOMAIN 14 [Tanacetum coccineum]